MTKPLIMAVPKGRIAAEFKPLLQQAGIVPELAFEDPSARQLLFKTNHPDFTLIRVRSFDVATFVGHGAADLGICGSDVLHEKDDREIYAPLDLGIGRCRLSVCTKIGAQILSPDAHGRVRVATKYPATTRRWFEQQGVQAECINLSGAMELAPLLNLTDIIVDLVATGATLRANQLMESAVIAPVSSRLILNRVRTKTAFGRLQPWLQIFSELVGQQAA
jgi:ATP phosphoribosyltransferase